MADEFRRLRRWLLANLRSILVPELVRRGFEVVPLDDADAKSPEMRSALPFGRLRRAGPNGVELVEIQLDKHGWPAFRLNFGNVPLEGIQGRVGWIEARDVSVHYLTRHYGLYHSRFFASWFAVSNWIGRAETEADYKALMQDVIALLPEVEATLATGVPGRHVRVVQY